MGCKSAATVAPAPPPGGFHLGSGQRPRPRPARPGRAPHRNARLRRV